MSGEQKAGEIHGVTTGNYLRSALFEGNRTACSGNPSPKFRDNLSVPSSRIKVSRNKNSLKECESSNI